MKEAKSFEHGGQIQKIAQRLNLHATQLMDFSASINPLGPPSCVKEVLSNAEGIVASYPDSDCGILRNVVAGHWDVLPDRVLAGNGSTELIFLIARVLAPARTVIVGPTFSEYERAVRLCGSGVAHVTMEVERNFQWDPSEKDYAAISQSGLCFVCNPNNPSGTLLPKLFLLEIIARFPKTVFVVDEAFIDFVQDPGSVSLLRESEKYNNLIVLRSFTKFYAIAGLRLGFALAHPSLIRILESGKEPWSVNALAQAVGERLPTQEKYAHDTRRWLPTERQWLARELKEKTSLVPFESAVNYLLLKIKHGGICSGELCRRMLRHRVILRDASTFHGLDSSYVRVAVKTRGQNAVLVSGLQDVLSDLSTCGTSKNAR